MTKRELRRAAHYLLSWANVIRASECVDGEWEHDPAKREHDEMVALSAKLYAKAREPWQRPLPMTPMARLRDE